MSNVLYIRIMICLMIFKNRCSHLSTFDSSDSEKAWKILMYEYLLKALLYISESVKALLGKHVKILLKTVVKLETKADKTENRVLVSKSITIKDLHSSPSTDNRMFRRFSHHVGYFY